MKSLKGALVIVSCCLLAACSTSPTGGGRSGGGGAHFKVGDPYQVNGQWYYPAADYSYDETGIASWYGDDFHGLRTANGELYNKNELTAAHKTLPMPSLARVTNLENGRSIVVRVNDRGPFSGSRIIDMSQRAAQLLGFEQQGTARVRVQVLADESKAIADAMRQYGSATPVQMASNNLGGAAGGGAVERMSLEEPSPESGNLNKVISTPETRAVLLKTKPVQEVVQLPVKATTNLYVQAGAFSRHENATKLQEKLSALGKTQITTAVVHGTTFYRVRVGPLADVSRADALVSKVSKMGVGTPKIVVD